MKQPATKYALLREQSQRMNESPTPVALWTRKLRKLRWWTMNHLKRTEGGTGRECRTEATEQVYSDTNRSKLWQYSRDLSDQQMHQNGTWGSELEWQRAGKRTQRKRELLQRKRQDRKQRKRR
jgi:hypothetical protein